MLKEKEEGFKYLIFDFVLEPVWLAKQTWNASKIRMAGISQPFKKDGFIIGKDNALLLHALQRIEFMLGIAWTDGVFDYINLVAVMAQFQGGL